jgi:hypothetical protein
MTENQKLWMAALRSGEYRQGKYLLKADGAFCCLGVACEISQLGSWDGSFYCANGYSEDRRLIVPVMHWLGMHQECGNFGTGSLTSFNDSKDSPKTFAEIADFIEANPTLFFKKETNETACATTYC